MGTSRFVAAVLLATTLAVPVEQVGGQALREIPLDAAWTLTGEGTRLEVYRRNQALRMRTGRAVRRDVSLQDGTIEFDMAVTRHRSFVYVQFRMTADTEYEEIYFRPHKSSLPDAIQYSPVWRGESNWQLYHGPGATAPVTFVADEWTHVRIVLKGRRAALFVGDGEAPVLVMALARESAPGHIAFRSFVPSGGAPAGESVASIANVVVRPGHMPYQFPAETAVVAPAGLITRWQISPAFKAEPGVLTRIPENVLASRASWPTFTSEPTGVAVIGRHVTRPAPVSAVAARLVLRASAEGVQRLDLGYSDYVTVLVNGRLLFAGDAHYSYDEPRQEGLIGLWQSTVWLPVRRGDNEVLLAVTDGFGGWGLMARLDPADGARLVKVE